MTGVSRPGMDAAVASFIQFLIEGKPHDTTSKIPTKWSGMRRHANAQRSGALATLTPTVILRHGVTRYRMVRGNPRIPIKWGGKKLDGRIPIGFDRRSRCYCLVGALVAP